MFGEKVWFVEAYFNLLWVSFKMRAIHGKG